MTLIADLDLKTLRTAVDTARGVAARSGTIRVLTHLRIFGSKAGGYLLIQATDLDRGVSLRVNCRPEADADICVPAKTFAERLALEAVERVSLAVEGPRLVLKGSGRATFAYLAGDDFPRLPEPDPGTTWAELALATVREVTSRALHAARAVDAKGDMPSVLLRQAGGRLTAYATDGHRLYRESVPVAAAGEVEAVLSESAVAALGGLAGELATIAETDAHYVVRSEDNVLSLRKVEVRHPNYEAAIEKMAPRCEPIRLDRQALLLELRRAELAVAPPGFAVRLTAGVAEGALRVTSTSDLGESAGEVATEGEGEISAAAFRVGYLIESLAAVGGATVLLAQAKPTEPLLVRAAGDDAPDRLALVMARMG